MDNFCESVLPADTCAISVVLDGLGSEICYKAGVEHPKNACWVCDPDTNPYGWSDQVNNTPCDDGDLCTDQDECGDGICISGTDVTCDDDYPCTFDYCDPSLGCQIQEMPGAPCDDGDPCTVFDICNDTDYGCSGTGNACDDGNPCTVNACTAGAQGDVECGGIEFVKEGAECDDGDPCTTKETCQGTGECVPNSTVDCPQPESPCEVVSCQPDLGCVTEILDGCCETHEDCGYLPEDGLSCTVHQCQNNVCIPNDAQNSLCEDDGFSCTFEHCNAEVGAQGYDPVTGCKSKSQSDLCPGDVIECTEEKCVPGRPDADP